MVLLINNCMIKKMKSQINKRIFSFNNTNTPLTSKRVNIILSSRDDSKNLANAVRATRHGRSSGSSFTISGFTKSALIKASAK
ncbi:hypothetical protein MNBD_GAMMA03-1427 [hydrothermal vent metagenome]|uniref:Uncharacterized protein n=1 Tax=hydrothermal vent metagenome TaxID=652676 RepID=A0A3B0W1G1_9ZZZZ